MSNLGPRSTRRLTWDDVVVLRRDPALSAVADIAEKYVRRDERRRVIRLRLVFLARFVNACCAFAVGAYLLWRLR